MPSLTGIYNKFKKNVFSPSDIDMATDTIKVALMTSGYVPDFDNDEFWSDISANESSGIGYTAGGEILQNKTITEDTVNNRGVFDADDVLWPGSTITARGCVLYKSTGNPATSKLIGYIDFLTNRSSSGGTFTIQWQSVGIALAS
jgi:hypothetical protein